MISVELLSEVLKEEVEINCADFNGKYLQVHLNNNIWYKTKTDICKINIHELAHKCKLHFYSDDEAPSYVFYYGSYEIEVVKVEVLKEPKVVYRETWIDTPYDVNQVFKACKWVLEYRNESK